MHAHVHPCFSHSQILNARLAGIAHTLAHTHMFRMIRLAEPQSSQPTGGEDDDGGMDGECEGMDGWSETGWMDGWMSDGSNLIFAGSRKLVVITGKQSP